MEGGKKKYSIWSKNESVHQGDAVSLAIPAPPARLKGVWSPLQHVWMSEITPNRFMSVVDLF